MSLTANELPAIHRGELSLMIFDEIRPRVDANTTNCHRWRGDASAAVGHTQHAPFNDLSGGVQREQTSQRKAGRGPRAPDVARNAAPHVLATRPRGVH